MLHPQAPDLLDAVLDRSSPPVSQPADLLAPSLYRSSPMTSQSACRGPPNLLTAGLYRELPAMCYRPEQSLRTSAHLHPDLLFCSPMEHFYIFWIDWFNERKVPEDASS